MSTVQERLENEKDRRIAELEADLAEARQEQDRWKIEAETYMREFAAAREALASVRAEGCGYHAPVDVKGCPAGVARRRPPGRGWRNS